ncbi:hypothetical protein GCM10027448_02510 [Nocardioides dilutus]
MGVGDLGGHDLQDGAGQALQRLGVVVARELDQVLLCPQGQIGVEVIGQSEASSVDANWRLSASRPRRVGRCLPGLTRDQLILLTLPATLSGRVGGIT